MAVVLKPNLRRGVIASVSSAIALAAAQTILIESITNVSRPFLTLKPYEASMGWVWKPIVSLSDPNISEWAVMANIYLDLSEPEAALARESPRDWLVCTQAELQYDQNVRMGCGIPAECSPVIPPLEYRNDYAERVCERSSQGELTCHIVHGTMKVPFVRLCLPSATSKIKQSRESTVVINYWLQHSKSSLMFRRVVMKVCELPSFDTTGNVTVELDGGLGNQLYKIFGTIAYSMRNGFKFHFTDSPYAGPMRVGEQGSNFTATPRKTYWNSLLRKAARYTTATPYDSNSIILDVDEAYPSNVQLPPPPPASHISLTSLFGKYRYFEDKQIEIMELLGLDLERNRICQNLFPKLFASISAEATTISIHFRIGDYKHHSSKFVIQKLSYYVSALAAILDSIGEDHDETDPVYALVFCEAENEEEVRGHVNELSTYFSYVVFYIAVTAKAEDWEEMLLMSCCNHHIIANSSFSWWAAYLHMITSLATAAAATLVRVKDSIVTYPSQYTVNPLLEPEELYPISWIEVSSGGVLVGPNISFTWPAGSVGPSGNALRLPIGPIMKVDYDSRSAEGVRIAANPHMWSLCLQLNHLAETRRCTLLSAKKKFEYLLEGLIATAKHTLTAYLMESNYYNRSVVAAFSYVDFFVE